MKKPGIREAMVPRKGFAFGADYFSFGLADYRVVDGQIETKLIGTSEWKRVPLGALLRFAVDGPLWDWLRSNGFRRPSPSGYAREEDRPTVAIKLRINREAAAALDHMAEAHGMSKTQLVTSWILEAAKR